MLNLVRIAFDYPDHLKWGKQPTRIGWHSTTPTFKVKGAADADRLAFDYPDL